MSAPASEPTGMDLTMMGRALDLARAAMAMDEAPVGAVIYTTASGDVLAEAHNRREIDADPTAHAEMIAIRRAARTLGDWRLNGCTLVVTLEPCAMCAGAIVNARLGRLIFGARDPKAGAVESLYQLCQDDRLNHRVTPVGGALAEPCGELLREFFRSKRAQ